MKRYPVTIVATLIGLAVCLYNYTGYDPHNMVFFMLSVPAWIVDLLIDVHTVSVLFMYVLTILSWAVMGYIADRLVIRSRERRRA